MRTDIILVISALLLVGLLFVRSYNEVFIPSVKAETGTYLNDIPASSPDMKIALAKVLIDSDNKDKLNDFELTGIRLILSDSTQYFEPLFFTPEAGVQVTTGKYFSLNPNDWESLSEAIIAITGIYKGEHVYFPFSLENLGDNTEGTNHLELSIELKDIANGSPEFNYPCDPGTFNVRIASL